MIHDVAIAIRKLQADGVIARAMTVDLDVHHGNGTAAIFAQDDSVYTFSMHQENNYPFEKPPGNLDVPLDDGCEDKEYLGLLRQNLQRALDEFESELIFYLAGADPYCEDQLGGLSLTLEGLRERDRTVFQMAAREEHSRGGDASRGLRRAGGRHGGDSCGNHRGCPGHYAVALETVHSTPTNFPSRLTNSTLWSECSSCRREKHRWASVEDRIIHKTIASRPTDLLSIRDGTTAPHSANRCGSLPDQA